MRNTLFLLTLLIFWGTSSNAQDFLSLSKYKNKTEAECKLIINSTTLKNLESEEIENLINDYNSCKQSVEKLSLDNQLSFYDNYSSLLALNQQFKDAIQTNNYVLRNLSKNVTDSIHFLHKNLQIYDFTGNNNLFNNTSNLIYSISKGDKKYNYGFNLSALHARNKNYRKAIEAWYVDKKQFHKIDDDSPFIITHLNDLGYYYLKNNQLDSAKTILERTKNNILISKNFENEISKNHHLNEVQTNLAKLLVFEQKFSDAEQLLNETLALAKKDNDYTNIINSELELINLYQKTNQLEKAAPIVEDIQNFDNNLFYRNLKLEKHQTLANYYSTTNNLDKANKEYQLALAEIEGLFKEESKKLLYSSEMAKSKYELERRKETEALENQKSKSSKNFRNLILGIITSLAIGVMVFTLSNNKKNKIVRKNLSKIEAQNQIINKAFKRNSFLLKELNHRVKNNLQVISGILSIEEKLTDNEEIQAITKKTRNRINSIALIHQQFIEQEFEQAVDISSYFETIIHSTIESFGFLNKVEIDSTIKVGNMPLDIISPLGLILNELVTNSCKHAFPETEKPKLVLKFIDSQNEYFFSYNDNGPGLKEETKTASIGMQLLPGLTQQIDGDIEMKNNDGFLCEIKIRK